MNNTMFVLKKFVSRDGYHEDETILIIDNSVKAVRDKWNAYVEKCKATHEERHLPPLMMEDAIKCSRSYTGGGCYAVFRFKIEVWEDKV